MSEQISYLTERETLDLAAALEDDGPHGSRTIFYSDLRYLLARADDFNISAKAVRRARRMLAEAAQADYSEPSPDPLLV